VGDGAIDFAALPSLLGDVGYCEVPLLEIISPEGDAGVLGSVDRLVAMGWPC
jgi:hypothetical protein